MGIKLFSSGLLAIPQAPRLVCEFAILATKGAVAQALQRNLQILVTMGGTSLKNSLTPTPRLPNCHSHGLRLWPIRDLANNMPANLSRQVIELFKDVPPHRDVDDCLFWNVSGFGGHLVFDTLVGRCCKFHHFDKTVTHTYMAFIA